ncbi:uncharacterized protein LOC121376340 [Gigantopelta aegis]|uniref:uncharacterized protein LOC121376340 n=1 Tax=Gigantopelta aegis TaxID=1735272 RepID=UPI001B88E0CB|nr:uncharacterized protein LOC121376340 [Gigantopelta aegis]
MASQCTSGVSGVVTYPLQEFVQLVDLPSTVAVTSGTYSRHIRISRGDVLLVRSHVPATLTLSFHNADSGGMKATEIAIDSNVKFMVLPPKPKSLDGQYQKTVYETVADLVEDCPTYFRANVDYDDPYLPGFSVKSGDTFRFVRIIHDSRDGHLRLECMDTSGNQVRLSADCKGLFTTVPDSRAYTVRELINQARVARRLKLSSENIQLRAVPLDIKSSPITDRSRAVEPELDSDVTTRRVAIPELPLTFKGVIHLHKPPEVIEVSPWGDLDVRWKIPLDTDLHVRLFSQEDYADPVGEDKIVSNQLSEFVEQYEYEFPVLATLLKHGVIHPDLTNNLKNVSDIIVHNVKTSQKLLCLDHRKKYFLIDGNVKTTFLEDPRTFENIKELLECPMGTCVKVLEDIYTDYPKPVCLKCGDYIVLSAQKPKSLKKRWRKSAMDQCEVIRCQKLGRNGESVKVSLPLDLDIKMEELLDFNKNRPITMDQMLSLQVPLPTRRVSVVNRQGAEQLPVPKTFKMVAIVSEEIITLSPLRYAEASAISPVLKTCIEIPIRHHFLLAYGRRLDFPQGYFVFPKPTHSVFIRVEKIRTRVAQQLESAISNDYEDIDYGEMDTTVGDGFDVADEDDVRGADHYTSNMKSSRSEGALVGIQCRREKTATASPIQRLSKVLSSMRKKRNRTKPASCTELSDKKSPVEVNEYHTPPASPGATSVQDDPYEQINIQLGLVPSLNAAVTHAASSASSSEPPPVNIHQDQEHKLPRTTSV